MKEVTKYKIAMIGIIIISPILYLIFMKFSPFSFRCQYLLLNGGPCYLCGTTRALQELFKFNLEKSLAYNHLGLFGSIYYIVLLISYVLYLLNLEKGIKNMKYQATLLSVSDIDKSKQFYKNVLGLNVTSDLGANATLTGGIALQTLDTWKEFIHKKDSEIIFENNAIELYFEEDDIDSFVEKLKNIKDIVYVHPSKEHPWGQRVVRFYDLDKHIIEVGENMAIVTKRFFDSGRSIEEIAIRMNVPVEYVNLYLNKKE